MASASVVDSCDRSTDLEDGVLKQLGLEFMPYTIRFGNQRVFDTPVSIALLLPSLSFIKDKKNYGLHFRMPIVRIPKEDYELVLGVAQSQHHRG